MGEAAFTLVGRALGNLTTPPHCYGEEPSWSETIFSADQNNPVLWCVGREIGSSDTLEVKVVMNRPVVGVLKTAITPMEAKTGTVSYPQLQCSGTWTEKAREPGSITFREVITNDPQRRCVRELDAVLTRTESGPHISIKATVGRIHADLVKQ